MSNPSYHHGNLRQALIDAALDVVEHQGYQSVSLRDVAKSLGVSPGAPYRHFPNRETLLVALASEGFRLLLQGHRRAVDAEVDAAENVYAMARSFIDFTEQHPKLFLLMYDSGLLMEERVPDELEELLKATYDEVTETMAKAIPEETKRRLRARMIAMWSTLYGYARLRQGHLLRPYMLGPLDQEEVEAAIVFAAVGELS